MAIDEEAAKRARIETAMQKSGLVILLDRAGGKLSFTEAEYQEVAARYGGKANLNLHMEVVREGQGEPTIELTLTRVPPGNAELPS